MTVAYKKWKKEQTMPKTNLSEPIKTDHLKHYRPVVYTPTEIAEYVNKRECASSADGNTWVAARPMSGFTTLRSRLKLALAVFRGQADVLQWEQGQ